jgi:hypothetical protein
MLKVHIKPPKIWVTTSENKVEATALVGVSKRRRKPSSPEIHEALEPIYSPL